MTNDGCLCQGGGTDGASPVGGVGQGDLVVQVQEGEGSDGPGLEAELVGDDLLHAAEVGHGEAALADADQLVGGRQVALLLRHARRHVEAAEADAGQVLRLHLETRHNVL